MAKKLVKDKPSEDPHHNTPHFKNSYEAGPAIKRMLKGMDKPKKAPFLKHEKMK